jgi:predicted RND superfamily exporter protein
MRSAAFGPAVMFAHISDKMMANLWVSSPVALLLVSFTLIIALRSLKLGLLSIIPNLMPLLMAFGMWGLIRWDMNFSMSGIIAMGLGIVVDDTVHFMSKYLRARRQQGLGPEDAVRYAFGSVGRAMWVTSFVLMSGFLVNTLSSFQFTFNMGFMTAMVIFFALAGDLLFLPALLLAADKGTGTRSLADIEREEQRMLEQEEEMVADV